MTSKASPIPGTYRICSSSNRYDAVPTVIYPTTFLPQKTRSSLLSNGILRLRRSILLLSWVSLAYATTMAQEHIIISRKYDMSDGLLGEGVQSILQDRQGFIWIKAGTALNKFDGYTFTNYSNNPSFSSILDRRGRMLFQDRSGKFWTRDRGGIAVFDPEAELYVHRFSADLLTGEIVRIRERHDGNLWLCMGSSIYLVNIQTFSVQKLDLPPDNGYSDILESKDSSMWIRNTQGLIEINQRTNQRFIYRSPLGKLHQGTVVDREDLTLLQDAKERLWMGMESGLALFDKQSKSFSRHLPDIRVSDLLENEDGRLWVCSSQGLFLFDPDSESYYQPTTLWCNQILRDRQGILWLATVDGLWQLNPWNNNIHVYHHFGELIGQMVEDANNEILMIVSVSHGIAQSRLFRFDPSLNNVDEFKHSPTDHSTYSGNFLRVIFNASDGTILAAGQVSPLERYNPASRSFDRIRINQNIDPYVGFMDSFGTLWLGGVSGGLERHASNFIEQKAISGFPEGTVSSIVEDKSHNLWIGSNGGLSRYNLITSKLDVFTQKQGDANGISHTTVNQVMIDQENDLWVATSGGLDKMIRGTENDVPRFIHWRRSKTGLPFDEVVSMVDGGDGTLWLACANMISHFYPKTNTFKNYDQRNGLTGKHFIAAYSMNTKGLRSSNGNIFFSSSNGLVVFHPDSLRDNPYVPPVIITGLSVNNKMLPVAGGHADTLSAKSPLRKSIAYEDSIKLTYHQNDFSIEFVSLNYINPENNKYKYRLEPYETEWTETTAENRSARYTNINPGNYIFRVIGSNNDGIWNDQGTSLAITITPPWWKTTWAYVGYAFGFFIVFLIWRNYENTRIKLKHRAEHLSELDTLKSRFFANISHEFRTPITLILGPLKDIYNGTSKEDPKQILGPVIRSGQRLLQLINQLLDLSKIEADKMILQTSTTNLVELLRGIASSYESLAQTKRIKFAFHSASTESILWIDVEKVEKIIHNLLSNAFKFTNEGGEVILELRVESKYAMITVRDSGIGIPVDQLDRIFDRFYQVDSSQTRGYEGSGLGMALAKELVELHRGKISVESEVGKGTTFTIGIPTGTAHLHTSEMTDHRRQQQSISLQARAIETPDEPSSRSTVTAIIPPHPVLLIVEDNVDMRRYIRKTLLEYYYIQEAVNGEEGFKTAQQIIPDLVISDIMMPEMDGYQLCEKLKANEFTSHIPVILLTAKADRESKLTGLKTGADDYLAKPFDREELLLIVKNHIEERRRMRERFSRTITLEPTGMNVSSLDEKFLKKILTLVEAHIEDESLSIEAFSEEAGYSRMQMYRKIKGLTGQTPSQFVRSIRLKRAAQLLTNKSDTVSQIAYGVGFGSLSYFTKCFKEQFGVTPGKYAATKENQRPEES